MDSSGILSEEFNELKNKQAERQNPCTKNGKKDEHKN